MARGARSYRAARRNAAKRILVVKVPGAPDAFVDGWRAFYREYPTDPYDIGARRIEVRRLKPRWRTLEHSEMQGRGSPIYVPMILTKEESEADGRR